MTLFIIVALLITFSIALMWALASCETPEARTQMGIKLPGKDNQ
jgi:hypothetical protein